MMVMKVMTMKCSTSVRSEAADLLKLPFGSLFERMSECISSARDSAYYQYC